MTEFLMHALTTGPGGSEATTDATRRGAGLPPERSDDAPPLNPGAIGIRDPFRGPLRPLRLGRR